MLSFAYVSAGHCTAVFPASGIGTRGRECDGCSGCHCQVSSEMGGVGLQELSNAHFDQNIRNRLMMIMMRMMVIRMRRMIMRMMMMMMMTMTVMTMTMTVVRRRRKKRRRKPGGGTRPEN